MPEFNGNFNTDRKLSGSLAMAIFIFGLLTILYWTLNQFDFQFRRLTIGDYIARYEIPPSSILDFPRNILLFMPFGFGLAAILDRRGWSRNRVRLTVLICGFLLTLTVESLQQFLPTRQPSVGDLAGNTLGALAGLLCYRLWQNREATADWLKETMAAPQKVLAILAVYVLLWLAVGCGLSFGMRFYDWDAAYRMMLGNERTGDRPWLGTVTDFAVFNRALEAGTARELLKDPQRVLSNDYGLLAYYPLTGGRTEIDVTGQQPDLIWKPTDAPQTAAGAVHLDGENWLETEPPVRDLSNQLQDTSQLSIRLSTTTAELDQIGPARILSISEDPLLRNLTLGQEGSDLIVRYRSPITGENGTKPQILFPGFFSSSDPIEFVVTFDGLSVNLLDSRSDVVQTLELVPGAAFYHAFLHPVVSRTPSLGQATAGVMNNWAYRLFFYILVFLPVGVLLSLPAQKSWPQRYRLLLMLCGLLLMPLLLEWVLVMPSGFGLRPLNVVTSVLVIGTTAWIFIPVVRRLFDR